MLPPVSPAFPGRRLREEEEKGWAIEGREVEVEVEIRSKVESMRASQDERPPEDGCRRYQSPEPRMRRAGCLGVEEARETVDGRVAGDGERKGVERRSMVCVELRKL
jgi:hypothetical protein